MDSDDLTPEEAGTLYRGLLGGMNYLLRHHQGQNRVVSYAEGVAVVADIGRRRANPQPGRSADGGRRRATSIVVLLDAG
jgi:hypothetical protein